MLVMKAPLVAAVSLFYLASLLALVGAFSPHSGVGRTTSTTTTFLPPLHHEKDAGTTTRRRATPVADRMTKNEQDLLFGNEENGKRSLDDPPKGGGNSSGGGSSSSSSALVDRLATVRTAATSCPDLWLRLAQACPAKSRAIYDSHHCDTKVDQTFAQFATTIQKSAAAFSSLGIQKGDKVALFGENSAVWLMIDQGVQLAGGATAVRGADAPTDELYYIYQHSDSKQIAVLQGPKLLKRLMLTDGTKRDELSNENGPIKTVILMNREKQTNEAIQELAAACQVTVHVFADLLEASQPITKPPSIAKTDLSTIVYTSGTTGRPKGVMLTHGNLLHQTGHRLGPTQRYEDSDPLPGEKMLSLLPGTCS
jgi:non-ribosomal peptide synthetase component F